MMNSGNKKNTVDKYTSCKREKVKRGSLNRKYFRWSLQMLSKMYLLAETIPTVLAMEGKAISICKIKKETKANSTTVS